MSDTNADMQALIEFLRERNLPLPYIPEALGAEVVALGENLYGAGENAAQIVDLQKAAELAESGSLVPSVAIGLGGRGMQSSTLIYHLAQEPLLLLFDIPWGTSYGSRTDEAAEVQEYFDVAAELVKRAPEALREGDRLIVTASPGAGISFLVQDVGAADPIVRSTAWQGVDSIGEVLSSVIG